MRACVRASCVRACGSRRPRPQPGPRQFTSAQRPRAPSGECVRASVLCVCVLARVDAARCTCLRAYGSTRPADPARPGHLIGGCVGPLCFLSPNCSLRPQPDHVFDTIIYISCAFSSMECAFIGILSSSLLHHLVITLSISQRNRSLGRVTHSFLTSTVTDHEPPRIVQDQSECF